MQPIDTFARISCQPARVEVGQNLDEKQAREPTPVEKKAMLGISRQYQTSFDSELKLIGLNFLNPDVENMSFIGELGQGRTCKVYRAEQFAPPPYDRIIRYAMKSFQKKGKDGKDSQHLDFVMREFDIHTEIST